MENIIDASSTYSTPLTNLIYKDQMHEDLYSESTISQGSTTSIQQSNTTTNSHSVSSNGSGGGGGNDHNNNNDDTLNNHHHHQNNNINNSNHVGGGAGINSIINNTTLNEHDNNRKTKFDQFVCNGLNGGDESGGGGRGGDNNNSFNNNFNNNSSSNSCINNGINSNQYQSSTTSMIGNLNNTLCHQNKYIKRDDQNSCTNQPVSNIITPPQQYQQQHQYYQQLYQQQQQQQQLQQLQQHLQQLPQQPQQPLQQLQTQQQQQLPKSNFFQPPQQSAINNSFQPPPPPPPIPSDQSNSNSISLHPIHIRYILDSTTKLIGHLNYLTEFLKNTNDGTRLLYQQSHIGGAEEIISKLHNTLSASLQSWTNNQPNQVSANQSLPIANINQQPQQQVPPPPAAYFNQPPCTAINKTNINSSNQLQQEKKKLEEQKFRDFVSEHLKPEYQNRYIDLTKSRLQDFKLLNLLGSGSFAKVRLVQHIETKRLFCMKILYLNKIVRLRQDVHVCSERDVMLSLDHKFIVRLYKTFKDEHSLYFLQEYIPGGELFDLIRSQKHLPLETTRFYAAEILLSLEYLHQNDIIYRDLKPENLLIDSDGHIKLTDFGFAKKVLETTKSLCGTPEYIAPEILIGHGHGKSVDWWSLGILIYEMLVGVPPFIATDNGQVFRLIRECSIREKIPDYLDQTAKDIIESLVVVDVNRRMGCTEGGINQLKNHPFFKGINWEDLALARNKGPETDRITAANPEDDAAAEDEERKIDSIVDENPVLKAKKLSLCEKF